MATPTSGAAPEAAGRAAIVIAAAAALMAALVMATLIYVRQDFQSFVARLAETREIQKQAGAVETALFDAELARRSIMLPRELPREAAAMSLIEAVRSRVDASLRRFEDGARARPDPRDAAMRFAASARAAAALIDADPAGWRDKSGVSRREEDAAQAVQTQLNAMRRAGADLQTTIDEELARRQSDVHDAMAILLGAFALFVAGGGVIIAAQTRDARRRRVARAQSESRASQEIAGLKDNVSRMQAALNRGRRQLELTLLGAGAQAFSLRSDGAVDWVGEPDPRRSGSGARPLRFEDLASEADRPRVGRNIARALAEAAPTQFEMRARRTDGAGDDWLRVNIHPQADGSAAMGSAVDITDLKERESRMFWLMRELSHRSKNLLAIVQAMARQTARTAPSLAVFERRFQERLRGLAAAHDLLVDSSYASADLEALIRSQFGPATHPAGARLALTGPRTALRPEAAQNLAMAFHELAANAQAHGALSVPDGRVAVAWRMDADRLLIDWTETGGPQPAPGAAKGFGATLITTNLPRSLDGDVRLTYEPEGVVCQMALPLRRLLPEAADMPTS